MMHDRFSWPGRTFPSAAARAYCGSERPTAVSAPACRKSRRLTPPPQRRMKVVVGLTDRLRGRSAAVEREPGRVHPHEPAATILHEEMDVGQRIEEREHLVGCEFRAVLVSA